MKFDQACSRWYAVSDEEIAIRKRIESQLGEISITIETVKEIPLNNNGKFQAVISKLTGSILQK